MPQSFQQPDSAPTRTSHAIKHVVLLIHGIRDSGGWQESAREIFEDSPSVRAIPVKFGYYDVLSFLAPYDDSAPSYARVLESYEAAVSEFPAARISVVAHSFGTFLTGKLLADNPKCRFHRILLCGSVLDPDFPWRDVRDQIGDDTMNGQSVVLNECGQSDIWPLLAAAARSRYGAVGRHGFNGASVTTSRWYNGGHDLFFRRAHMQLHWVPFIINGVIEHGNARPPKPHIIERCLATVPGVQTLTSVILTVIWFVLKFWYAVAIAIGVLALLSHDSVECKTVDFAAVVTELKTFCDATAKSNQDNPQDQIQNEYVKPVLTDADAPRKRLCFKGVIINGDMRDGKLQLEVAPKNNVWFQSKKNDVFQTILIVSQSSTVEDISVLNKSDEGYLPFTVRGAVVVSARPKFDGDVGHGPDTDIGGTIYMDATDGEIIFDRQHNRWLPEGHQTVNEENRAQIARW